MEVGLNPKSRTNTEQEIRIALLNTKDKRKKLGYEPKVSFEEGMKGLVEWASKIEAKDGFDEAYKELKEKRLVEK